MGRKKRKLNDAECTEDPVHSSSSGNGAEQGTLDEQGRTSGAAIPIPLSFGSNGNEQDSSSLNPVVHAPPTEVAPHVIQEGTSSSIVSAPPSSGYAMTSHSGEIIHDDVYVSDGSEDSDVEVVLVGSRNGIMRRGLGGGIGAHKLIQPNRQWVRGNAGDVEDGSSSANNHPDAAADRGTSSQQDDSLWNANDLAHLDPAQRAARLLQEKQRKLELEKILARQRESEENAGRDPTLFSKRTAFDIRFDQIEDKPWMRGSGEVADFFNYDLQEEDWLEYSQQQLLIRQELIDAARQKRPIDLGIVPVTPRTPTSQTPRVAVAAANSSAGAANREGEIVADSVDELVAGPEKPSPQQVVADTATADSLEPTKNQYKDLKVIGGAWGALPGSKLAKLMEVGEGSILAQTPPDNAHDGFGQQSDTRSAYSNNGQREVPAAIRGRGINSESAFRSRRDDPPTWNVAGFEDHRRPEFYARPNDRAMDSHPSLGAGNQHPAPPEDFYNSAGSAPHWYSDGGSSWQQAPPGYPPQAGFRGGYRGPGGGGRTAPFPRGGRGGADGRGDPPDGRPKRPRDADTWRR